MPGAPKADSLYAREMAKLERDLLTRFLKKHHGHLGNTAAELGLSYRALGAKVAEHGLQAEAAALRAEVGTTGPRNA